MVAGWALGKQVAAGVERVLPLGQSVRRDRTRRFVLLHTCDERRKRAGLRGIRTGEGNRYGSQTRHRQQRPDYRSPPHHALNVAEYQGISSYGLADPSIEGSPSVLRLGRHDPMSDKLQRGRGMRAPCLGPGAGAILRVRVCVRVLALACPRPRSIVRGGVVSSPWEIAGVPVGWKLSVMAFSRSRSRC